MTQFDYYYHYCHFITTINQSSVREQPVDSSSTECGWVSSAGVWQLIEQLSTAVLNATECVVTGATHHTTFSQHKHSHQHSCTDSFSRDKKVRKVAISPLLPQPIPLKGHVKILGMWGRVLDRFRGFGAPIMPNFNSIG